MEELEVWIHFCVYHLFFPLATNNGEKNKKDEKKQRATTTSITATSSTCTIYTTRTRASCLSFVVCFFRYFLYQFLPPVLASQLLPRKPTPEPPVCLLPLGSFFMSHISSLHLGVAPIIALNRHHLRRKLNVKQGWRSNFNGWINTFITLLKTYLR